MLSLFSRFGRSMQNSRGRGLKQHNVKGISMKLNIIGLSEKVGKMIKRSGTKSSVGGVWMSSFRAVI